jgi:hypothetical protein
MAKSFFFNSIQYAFDSARRPFFILITLILGSQTITNAQFVKEIIKNNRYLIGAGAFLSTSENLPFWLHANQYGEVPLTSQFLQFSGSVHHEYDSLYTKAGKLNKFGWGYGARAVANVGKVNQFIISEGFLKARFSAFEIYAGRRKEIFGLVDTTLTSGSYIWSGNALPMPKIQISIPNYTSILKNGFISIKGGFAHGWFDKKRLYTSDLKLHQKWLYFRLGKPSWKINFFAGGNHQAQWGGNSPFFTVNGKLPDGFQNYIHVVLGTRGAITGVPETKDFDANRIGNHLGSIDIAASIKLDQNELLLYRQSFYEDGSLFYLNNISDGLLGISIKLGNQKLALKKISVEYLNTINQGGQNFLLFSNSGEVVPPELRGADQYFNNAQIKDGWVNNNKTIGTPFISVPNQETSINNNRVKVWHLALHADYKSLNLYIKNSLVMNLGTYSSPMLGKSRLASLIHIRKRIKRNDLLSINLSSNPTTNLSNTILGLNISYIKNL